MRGREAPMDLDLPKGYSPCWLDESPPKAEITEKKENNKQVSTPLSSVDKPSVSHTPVDQIKPVIKRRSPFYTPSPLGTTALRKNRTSFWKRLRKSAGDRDQISDDDLYESKSTGWGKKQRSFMGDHGTNPSHQYGQSHLFLPYVLMGYLQVIFNVAVISGILFFVVQFALTIRKDVEIKVEEHLNNIMSEISHCSRQYIENRCNPEHRVPAMEKVCLEWELCMKRDPSTIGRARLHAETFAEVINGLIDPISYKTMIFILIGVFGTMYISNYAFSAVRSRSLASSLRKRFSGNAHAAASSPFSRNGVYHHMSLNDSPLRNVSGIAVPF